MRSMYQPRLGLWCLTIGMALSLFILDPALAEDTSQPETLVWNRAPLRIALPVNRERRVDFPVEVIIYIPDAIANKMTATATLEGSLFFCAREAFATQRVVVTDKSGRVQWLLDISADAKAPLHPLVIRDSRVQPEIGNTKPPATHEAMPTPPTDANAEPVVDEVDLIKLAARQFYGPSRLADLPPGVSGALIDTGPVDLYRGADLETVVQGAWRTTGVNGGLYVTAVRVTNRSQFEVRPDPRRIRGTWKAIAAQHAWLAPAGQFPQDTTYWYLVSSRPLQEVMTP